MTETTVGGKDPVAVVVSPQSPASVTVSESTGKVVVQPPAQDITITVQKSVSLPVVEIETRGPQGPQGPKGEKGETGATGNPTPIANSFIDNLF